MVKQARKIEGANGGGVRGERTRGPNTERETEGQRDRDRETGNQVAVVL